ncbi:MAG: hypothetical protein ACFCUI_01570 [Bernardetiaceae bacterium]
MLLLYFLGGVILAGAAFWWWGYSQQEQDTRLQASFVALEKKYERLIDDELGIRWKYYETLSEHERRQQLQSRIWKQLKPDVDALFYLIVQERGAPLIRSEKKYFIAPIELSNLYLQQRNTSPISDQEPLREAFLDAIAAHLEEKLLYLER